jgi:hypothetical protein
MKVIEFDEFKKIVIKRSEIASADYRKENKFDTTAALEDLFSRVDILFVLMRKFDYVFVEAPSDKHMSGCACKLLIPALIGAAPYCVYDKMYEELNSEVALVAARAADEEGARILGAMLIGTIMENANICIVHRSKLE